ncbi:hypothetical protein GBA52_003941 [Prunus armeniaca]|nr:hypothetical protein GBA52_003941 [Prunus armeniaca]
MREGFEIFKGPSKSLGRVKYFHLDHQEWDRAHIHVFWNTPEVQPYIREHVECEKATRRPRMTVLKSQHQAHKSFPQWFHKHIYNQIQNGVGQVSDDLRALASGPKRWADLWTRCTMNSFQFHVKSIVDGLKSQNSGVFVFSQTDSYATA